MVTVLLPLAGIVLPLPDHAVWVAVTNVAAPGLEGSVTASIRGFAKGITRYCGTRCIGPGGMTRSFALGNY